MNESVQRLEDAIVLLSLLWRADGDDDDDDDDDDDWCFTATLMMRWWYQEDIERGYVYLVKWHDQAEVFYRRMKYITVKNESGIQSHNLQVCRVAR